MKKPLKVAAWSGLISVILSVVIFSMTFLFSRIQLNPFVSFISALIGAALGVLFLNGFLILAKKFKNKLLLVVVWIGIVLFIISVFFSLFGSIFSVTPNVSAQTLNGEIADFNSIEGVLILLLIFWVLFSLVIGAFSILFGIGILRLGKKVPYSKPAGTLEIIAGATYIIFVGFLVRTVALIYQIALLLKASEKFEK